MCKLRFSLPSIVIPILSTDDTAGISSEPKKKKNQHQLYLIYSYPVQ